MVVERTDPDDAFVKTFGVIDFRPISHCVRRWDSLSDLEKQEFLDDKKAKYYFAGQFGRGEKTSILDLSLMDEDIKKFMMSVAEDLKLLKDVRIKPYIALKVGIVEGGLAEKQA